MNNSSQKKDEILITEEEPVPEEYNESKFKMKPNLVKPSINPSFNASKNFQSVSEPNTVLHSKPNINNINHFNNKNHNTNTNNNSITLSRVSKAKTALSYYNNSKFENYNLEKMRYNFLKDYSYIHVDKNENFMKRMQFDIHKRQLKEDRINALIEQNKVKIDEDERISAFNRLISDANRRLEAQENMENIRKGEAAVLQRRAHALPRFLHGGVRQAHQLELRDPARQIDLHAHRESLDPAQAIAQHDGKHQSTPRQKMVFIRSYTS